MIAYCFIIYSFEQGRQSVNVLFNINNTRQYKRLYCLKFLSLCAKITFIAWYYELIRLYEGHFSYENFNTTLVRDIPCETSRTLSEWEALLLLYFPSIWANDLCEKLIYKIRERTNRVQKFNDCLKNNHYSFLNLQHKIFLMNNGDPIRPTIVFLGVPTNTKAKKVWNHFVMWNSDVLYSRSGTGLKCSELICFSTFPGRLTLQNR